MATSRTLAFVFWLWCGASAVIAQAAGPARSGTNAFASGPVPPPQSNSPTTNATPAGLPLPAALSKTPLKEVQLGIFEFGGVRIDKRQRTVSFPAVVNLRRGLMEYLLVTSWGKVHESILRTEVEPYRVHAAMLLLGAKGIGTNDEEIAAAAGPFISHPSSARIPGDKIVIEVKWIANGKELLKRAEQLVTNTKTKSVLRKGTWVYNGSFFEGESFLAQREGSLVSLVTDPEALMNNTGPGHDDDSIWTANTKALPITDGPVEIIITLTGGSPKGKK